MFLSENACVGECTRNHNSICHLRGKKKISDLWKKTLQHQALFVNLISQAFIRRGLLSRRYVRLFNKESGCVWFKEQGDSVSIRAPPGDSPISQVKCSGGGASNKVHTISVIHHRGQIYKQQGVRSAVVWTLLKVEEESLPFSCNRMETTPQPPLDRCLDLGVINKPRSDAQRDNFFSVVQYVVRIGVQPRKCKISSLQRSLSETFAAVV